MKYETKSPHALISRLYPAHLVDRIEEHFSLAAWRKTGGIYSSNAALSLYVKVLYTDICLIYLFVRNVDVENVETVFSLCSLHLFVKLIRGLNSVFFLCA